MTTFTRATQQATCAACTLGYLRDCPACAFYIEYPTATDEIDRLLAELWGWGTIGQVMEDGELLDLWQLEHEVTK